MSDEGLRSATKATGGKLCETRTSGDWSAAMTRAAESDIGRVRLSLATTLAGLAIAAQLLLLPPLYLVASALIRQGHEALFLEQARATARRVSAQLEVADTLDSPSRTRALLNAVIVAQGGLYAELRDGERSVASDLGRTGLQLASYDAAGSGPLANDLHVERTPVQHAGRTLELRLGFDARPVRAALALEQRQLIWALGAYLVLSTLAALLLGRALVRPVRRLARGVGPRASDARAPKLPARVPVGEGQATRDAQHRERLQTMGTLAAGMAHEFNNLLVPVTVLSELVSKRLSEGNPSQADLQSILSAARRARELAGRILAFSRALDAPTLQSVDLRDAVTEALRLFAPLMSPNAQLQVVMPHRCAPVHADRSLLMQLILNLCTNAYRALGNTPGVLTVSARDTDIATGSPWAVVPGRYVELSVQDSGRGMNSVTLKRAFEPFFTTAAVGEGTGLGLAVVQGIVDSFGAAIHVDSAPGAGSTFKVLFAAADVDSIE
jgi:signal transduction histidine kinase